MVLEPLAKRVAFLGPTRSGLRTCKLLITHARFIATQSGLRARADFAGRPQTRAANAAGFAGRGVPASIPLRRYLMESEDAVE